MSIIGSNILAGASGQGGGYTIERSVRLRSSASAYLNRTPASAGNRQRFTLSAWVKRGSLGGTQNLLSVHSSTSGADGIRIDGDQLNFYTADTTSSLIKTTAVLRDPAAWYAILVAVDTTQATASSRVRMYINGIEQTSFASSSYPAQNLNTSFNEVSRNHAIGRNAPYANEYLDGYLTEVNCIDGQALTPSDFGEYNEDTGVWQPIAYTGTYGTNGFYLDFSDNTTTTTLAEDKSGQGNDWTANNISLTSGVTYDSMTDTPTIYAGGGNYAVLNPLSKNTSTVISNGNLSVSGNVIYGHAQPTMFVSSDKWYFEAQLTTQQNDTGLGLGNFLSNPQNDFIGGSVNSVGYLSDGRFFYNGSALATYASYTTTDVVACAFDCATGKIWVAKNNTWQNSGDPAAGTGQVLTASWSEFGALARTVGSGAIAFNFGQRPFAYTPPTGFKALHTGNLPEPEIVDGSAYFNAVTYTGNGSTQSVTVGFQPDLIWGKARNAAYSHALHDAIRGFGNRLVSNDTGAESFRTDAFQTTAVDSTGFNLGSQGDLNYSGNTMVAWNWKANGAGVSNTDGSIASTVSANPTAGFSIVTYTGGGAGSTIGHGLAVAPKIIIVKDRVNAADWCVYTSTTGAGAFLKLNTTAASATDTTMWGNTSPTSSVFTWGYGSGVNYVAYCFSEVEGYSKFGSYTGNGSADGVFVFTGGRPAFVMIKRTDTTENWQLYDSARNTSNVVGEYLLPNSSSAGATITVTDLLSNGFKIRVGGTNPGINASGGTYIYMAFAENPFKHSLAR